MSDHPVGAIHESPLLASAARPFEIGKFYVVPTVRGKLYHIDRNWPVLGPKHEDSEFIGFPEQHYHVDWRFVPDRDYRHSSLRLFTRVATPLMQSNGGPNCDLPSPMMRRRKYQRAFDVSIFQQVRWLLTLETAYASCKMTNLICPHRGLPLNGCPQDGDVVTCPGHGLRWNVKTGELVKRINGGANG